MILSMLTRHSGHKPFVFYQVSAQVRHNLECPFGDRAMRLYYIVVTEWIKLFVKIHDSVDANSTLRTQAIRVLPGLGAGVA